MNQRALLHLLADGRFHSGQDLADAIGVSRSAVWKQVRALQERLGLNVMAVPGRGYRLDSALEVLDAARIRDAIGQDQLAKLEALDLLDCIDSTNIRALEAPPERVGRGRVWLAEHQTAGRGRRGRQWVSSYGRNLYLSFAWRFDLPMADLAGLSLAAGTVVAEVLAELGSREHHLKWPNDVLVGEAKLGGILVEVAGEATGPVVAVVGIGLNLDLDGAEVSAIDQPWTDWLRAVCAPISRNRLAALLTDGLTRACETFAAERLGPFIERWSQYDRLREQGVVLISPQQRVEGRYQGIARDGAIRIATTEGLREYHAGEVSLRRSVVV